MNTYQALNFKHVQTKDNFGEPTFWCVDNLYRECLEDFMSKLFRDFVEYPDYNPAQRIQKLIDNYSYKVQCSDFAEVLHMSSNSNRFKGQCSAFIPYVAERQTNSGFSIRGRELPLKDYKEAVYKFNTEFLNAKLLPWWPILTIHIIQLLDQYYCFYTLQL